MKKPNKKNTVNLFFSAFLILAFVVCAHFFSNFALGQNQVLSNVIKLFVYTVFGLLLFYATRVGDGKPVKRFSPITLIIMVLPALYIMIASIASGMPLHSAFVINDSSISIVTTLAAVVFGYGIPYTFLSGFEIAEEENESEKKFVEGGIEADIQDVENEEESEETSENAEETETSEENTEE